eukprot:1161592-Pelagomonas_calceolata.AAC.6
MTGEHSKTKQRGERGARSCKMEESKIGCKRGCCIGKKRGDMGARKRGMQQSNVGAAGSVMFRQLSSRQYAIHSIL